MALVFRRRKVRGMIGLHLQTTMCHTWTKLGRVCWGLKMHNTRSHRSLNTTCANNPWMSTTSNLCIEPNTQNRDLNTHHSKMAFISLRTSPQSRQSNSYPTQFTSLLSHPITRTNPSQHWRTTRNLKPKLINRTPSNTLCNRTVHPCTPRCTVFRKICRNHFQSWIMINRCYRS